MFRKTQNINDICQEREQMLSQLRRSKRMNMLNEKRNNIVIYNSFNELLNNHHDSMNSESYLSDCIEMIEDNWDESIGCVFILQNNHFLISKVDDFSEIPNIMSDFGNYKYIIIVRCYKYIYIDNQIDLHNLIENGAKLFKWVDARNSLLLQTYNEFIYDTPRHFYTNILEEAFNYIKQNHDGYHFPILLELDVTDGCSNYIAIHNDYKKYEIVNEIDLLNQNIMSLKNIINLNQRKYVASHVANYSDFADDIQDCKDYNLRLIQIDTLEQLEYLKQYIDNDRYVYKPI